MPLAGYFRNIGALLLALLFIADYYLPKSAVVEREMAHPPVIRIFSVEKLPDRIDLDTTQTPVTVAIPANSSIETASMPNGSGTPPIQSHVAAGRDAFALAPPADSRPQTSIGQDKRQLKTQRIAARTKRHARPRMIVVAQPRQFAWFGFRYW